MVKKNARPVRSSEVLKRRALAVGCVLSSLGDTEQLAGVDVQSEKERHDLWWQFSHLFTGQSRVLFDAVMDHCADIALKRIESGELCLLGATR